MSYQDFTLEMVRQRFGLTIESNQDLFWATLRPATRPEAFTSYLSYSVPLALAINTEKARSEMIIAPMLVELKRLTHDQISLFSGAEFNVDAAQELTGFCDFMISRSRQQLYISAPAFIVFEAKNENIKGGLGQLSHYEGVSPSPQVQW